jgi:hypothetical protein
MAKARTGYSAATSKDKESVGSSFKRFVQLIFLVGVASVFKLNADTNYMNGWTNSYSRADSETTVTAENPKRKLT